MTGARTVTPVAAVTQDLFLSGVAVRAHGSAVVALGDSITNGANTQNNLNHRWPDLLHTSLLPCRRLPRYRSRVATRRSAG